MSKKSNAFYEKVFSTHPAGSDFYKWCWPAFFFGTVWLAYRKVYKPMIYFALLSFGLQLFESLNEVTGLLKNTNSTGFTSMLIVSLMIGAYGVSFYGKQWVQSKVTHDQHTSYLLAIGYILSVGLGNILIYIIGIILFSILLGQDVILEFEL